VSDGVLMTKGPAVWCALCPGCYFWIVLEENARRVDDGRKGHGTITTLVRCPNPKCNSREFWVEEEKMHGFYMPREISDLGYFDESEIRGSRVVPVDPFCLSTVVHARTLESSIVARTEKLRREIELIKHDERRYRNHKDHSMVEMAEHDQREFRAVAICKELRALVEKTKQQLSHGSVWYS